MTLSLAVLDDLGVNLYSSLPAVLSEAVANAWDADATKVSIVLSSARIVIADDGEGMTIANVNERFLKVGYRRRDDRPATTPKKRHVMGRKGIGKLSLFAIAEVIQVETIRDEEHHGFIMCAADIRTEIGAGDGRYRPQPMTTLPDDLKKGTRVTLTSLKVKVDGRTLRPLRKRLARRFSIIGPASDFEVTTQLETGTSTAITTEDRGYWKSVEFLWAIGEGAQDTIDHCSSFGGSLTTTRILDGAIAEDPTWLVSGWIGTVKEQKQLDEGDNVLPVLAHGKLVQEDLLSSVKQGGIFSKYIVGEIQADFVDFDNLEDIATSDRQSLKESDPRFAALVGFLADKLRAIGTDWSNWRRESATDEARKYASIDKWYKRLKPDQSKRAKQLFGKIATIAVDREDQRRELYKHGILAFERLSLAGLLEELDKLAEEGVESFLPVFAQLDDIEASLYLEVARARVEIIKRFDGLVDADAKERVLQEHLFDHLWLLHPSWERPTEDSQMEKRVEAALEQVTETLTREERAARLDIQYRSAAGSHVIVELKRYSVKPKGMELVAQLQKYKSAITKVLEEKFPSTNHHVEMVCIVGRRPDDLKPEEMDGYLRNLNARLVTYDELIGDAKRTYGDYLEAARKASDLAELLDDLDKETLDETSA